MQEPLKLWIYHDIIRIFKYGRFLPFLLQWLYFPLKAHNFWHSSTGNQFDYTLLIWGQESELSNLIVIINAEKY
jgi:hypothetical protein